MVGYDNINAIKPMLKDGRVLATADQYAAKQAVFGIDTALKALAEHKKQSQLSGVVETPVDARDEELTYVVGAGLKFWSGRPSFFSEEGDSRGF